MAKLPAPSDAAQKAAVAVIAEVYKPDYEKAKTPAEKIGLAKKLLNEGDATKDDLNVRFVLFRVARDIAAQQGDLATSCEAIARIDREYEADVFQQRLDAATTAVKALRADKDRRDVATLLQAFSADASEQDRYDVAGKFVALALTSAKERREADLIKMLTAQAREIETTAADFAAIQPALAKMRDNPTDQAANAAVGKFYCFAKRDWQRGVTMLALGNDELAKAAAVLELEEKPEPLKIGDGWWQVAESLEGSKQESVQRHAAEFYRRALPALSGLTKTRVERAIAALGEEVVVTSTPSVTPMPPVSPANKKIPSLVGVWQESPGVVVVVTQTGGQFKGTTTYQHPKSGQIRAVISGTINAEGNVIATLKHTQAPADWQSQRRTGALSPDGKVIRGKVVMEDGSETDFEWTLQLPETKYLGTWVTQGGNTVVLAKDGILTSVRNGNGRWMMSGGTMIANWDDGTVSTFVVAEDANSLAAQWVLKNGTKGSGVWKRK